MMPPVAWLTPRALAEAAGPWREDLSLNDDGEYFCRVLLAAAGIVFCADARSFYRSGLPGSLSKRADRRALESLWLSTQLNCDRLLAACGDRSEARAAVANGWQWLAFECYPGRASTSRTRPRARLPGARRQLPIRFPVTGLLPPRRRRAWLARHEATASLVSEVDESMNVQRILIVTTKPLCRNPRLLLKEAEALEPRRLRRHGPDGAQSRAFRAV